MDLIEDCLFPYQHYDLLLTKLTDNGFHTPPRAVYHDKGTDAPFNCFQHVQRLWHPNNPMMAQGMFHSSVPPPICPTNKSWIKEVTHRAVTQLPKAADSRARKYVLASKDEKLTDEYKEKRRKNLESVKKCRKQKRKLAANQARKESESASTMSTTYAALLEEHEQMKIRLSQLETEHSILLSRMDHCSHCAVCK